MHNNDKGIFYGLKLVETVNKAADIQAADFSLTIENAHDPKYPKALVAEGFTKNLRLKSVAYCSKYPDMDTINLFGLYASPDVMGNYAAGEIKTLEQARERMLYLRDRMQNGDPYSGYMIYDAVTNEFLGMSILGHSDKAGEAELALLLNKKSWKQSIATEISLLLIFVAERLSEDYMITNYVTKLDAANNKEISTPSTDKLNSLTATTKQASVTRILKQLGFKQVGTSNIYGDGENSRAVWSIDVADIKPILQQTADLSAVRQKLRARL